MDGALVDVGSHHPKKRNDNLYVGFMWACVLSIELRFCFFFLLLEQTRTWFS